MIQQQRTSESLVTAARRVGLRQLYRGLVPWPTLGACDICMETRSMSKGQTCLWVLCNDQCAEMSCPSTLPCL